MNRNEWMETVLREVRFAPDRRKIRQELAEHMEDRMEEYLEFAGDAAMDSVEQRVLDSMGDPVELGRQLNQQHKPWLGWLWMASRAALAVTSVMTLILIGAAGFSGWMDRPGTMDLEAKYASEIKYYDKTYNHSGDMHYNWQTDHTEELLESEITFRNFVYDDYDGRLVVYVTSEGPYAFGGNSANIVIDGKKPMSSEWYEGKDEHGACVGLQILTWERFDRETGQITVSYDKFGERFAFEVDLASGEVKL